MHCISAFKNINDIRKTIPDISEYVDISDNFFDGVKLNSFKPTTEEELKGITKEFGIKSSN